MCFLFSGIPKHGGGGDDVRSFRVLAEFGPTEGHPDSFFFCAVPGISDRFKVAFEG